MKKKLLWAVEHWFLLPIAAFLVMIILGFAGVKPAPRDTTSVSFSVGEKCEPQIALLLDEAYGNPTATKLIFDFAEEIGYSPADVFGPYCFDMRSHTIHDTDAECVNDIPFEDRMSCWVYNCYSLQQTQKTVTSNSFLSQFDWTICPVCLSNNEN